ncbi:MAG: Ig-like domain-containing protein [Pseudomonadota bacterium]|nr:Ig-like domain-containing protein [Pseudomonadota bacterium]
MSTTQNQENQALETTETGTKLFAGLPEEQAAAQTKNVLTVSAPKGNSSEAYTVEPGDVIKLTGFNPSDATFKVDGNNLIISVEGQPDIYLLDFAKLQGTDAGNTTFIELTEGATVDANSLLAQLTPEATNGNGTQVAASDENINEIEPAAGPAAGAAGGAGFTPPPVANDSFSANTVNAEVIGDFLVDSEFGQADERLLETPNRAPDAVDDNGGNAEGDAHTVKEDAVPNTVSGNVLANDTDPDGDTLSVANPGTYTLNYGTLTINVDGTYTYALDNSNPTVNALDDGDTLTDSFTYRATDGQLQSPANLNIRILGTNDGPELNNDVDPNDNSLSIKEDAVPNFTSGNVLDNDVDPDGDVLTVVNPGTYTLNYGTLVINADGTYTYTLDNSNPTVDALDNGDTLSDSFTYEATDGDLNDTAVLTITIHGTNDAPALQDDVNSIFENATPDTVTGNVLANDTDVEGDAITVSNPGIYVLNYGTLTLNGDGSYSYQLDNSNPTVNNMKAGDSIQDAFIYRATDGKDSSTANLTITIHGTNDGPVANDDVAATDEDTPITIPASTILANDYELEGDTFNITAVNVRFGGGTAVLNADGSVTYTPLHNYNGPAQLEYTITDTDGLSDTAVIDINVISINDVPLAEDDSAVTHEDVPVRISNAEILRNDSDPEGDALTITTVRVVSGGGSAILQPNGDVVYTPALNYNGPAVLEYVVTDGNGDFDSAFINIDVLPVNDAISALDDYAETPEDTPITIPSDNILANDYDPEGDPLTITAVSVVSGGGSVTLNADGSVTYTPAPNYSGPAVLEYTVDDGNGSTDTALINITVTPENDPDAVDDFATTREDTTIVIPNATILANDVDDMGLALTITEVRLVSGGGSVTLLANGDVSYTPAPNYNGPVVLEYTIQDPNGNEDSANIYIAVTPVNDGPVAVDDFAVMNEDSVLVIPEGTLLANDTDPEGDPLTVTHVTVVSGGGTATVDASGNVTYVPALNYNGPVVLEYTINDGNGGTDTALVNIDVLPVNDAPVANDDAAATDEDTPITISNADILSNDFDVDGDVITITGVRMVTGQGTAVLNADGSVTYTPTANYHGPAEIEYTIEDEHGATDTAIIRVTVRSVNDGPQANDDAFTTPEDTAITMTSAQILSNDTDPEGDPLSITSVIVVSGGGTAVLNADGSVTYTPAADYNGPAVLEYVMTDGTASDSAFININVTPVNDAPDANDDSFTTAEDTALTIPAANILANDTDPDGDTLTITGVSVLSGGGTAVLNADGSVTYTPAADYHGPAVLEYSISDGNGGTDTARINITVTPENDPDAVDDFTSTNEDTTVIIPNATILANDVDDMGMTLTITNVRVVSGGGTVQLLANGDVSYTPAQGYNGSATLEYTITDPDGNTDSANIFVAINPVNDGPTAVNDVAVMNEDTVLVIPEGTLLANDSDPDGDPLNVTGVTVVSGGGTATIDSAGNVTYVPALNYNGPVVLEYSISDGNGGTDTALVNITVNPVNDDPNARNDNYTTAEDTSVGLDLLANDTDVDGDTLTITHIAGVALTGGAQSIDVGNGRVEIAANGSMRFHPDANWNGTETFNYQVSDGNGGTDTATVRVNVDARNDGPDARNDNYTTNEDTSVNLNLLANDTDPDGDTLTITHIDGVALTGNAQTIDVGNGRVIIASNGTMRFQPDASWNGTEAFSYQISDGNGGSDTATVRVTVRAVNDGPDARNDNYTTDEDVSVNLNLLANDTDPEGDTLRITHIDGTALTGNAQTIDVGNGRVIISSTGAMRFEPDANWNGIETFNYTITDGNGGTDTARVTVEVCAVNDGPDARNDNYTTDEDTAVNINLLANDTDIDGDTLRITHIAGTALTGGAQTIDVGNGRVIISSTGAMRFQPDNGWFGTETFNYRITDGNGGSDTATVRVVVREGNNGPDAKNDSYTTNEDTSVNLNLLANDTDPDGDTLRITHIEGVRLTGSAQTIDVGNGRVIITSAGAMRFQPDANWNGTETFSYRISDGNGGVDSARVTINVKPVNDGPDAKNDSFTINEDQTLYLNGGSKLLANDRDIDGDSLNITHINGVRLTGGNQNIDVGRGTVVVGSDGSMQFRPDRNWNGTETFTYRISDGNGGSDTATVTVKVRPVNDGPNARNDSVSVNENQSIAISVLNNDTDPDGDALHITRIVSGPNFGSAYVSGGRIIYTAGSVTSDRTVTFRYEISDGHGGTDIATVTVNVRNTWNPGGDGGGDGGGDCPLIIDLDGDGLELIALEDSNAMFDVDGDGQAEHTAWASSDDGILAMDWNGDGIINDVTEVFGNSLQDGFTELIELDDNGDGVINQDDSLFSSLQVWQDYNGDGISDAGELSSLADHGITSLGAVGNENPMVINGQTITHTSSVEYADGTSRDIYSVWFQNENTSSSDHNYDEIDLTGDSLVGFSVSLDDVLSTASNTLVISGDDGDAVTTTEFTERNDNVTIGDQTYASFTDSNHTGTILIELGLTVNGETMTDVV